MLLTLLDLSVGLFIRLFHLGDQFLQEEMALENVLESLVDELDKAKAAGLDGPEKYGGGEAAAQSDSGSGKDSHRSEKS
jgi:hypothetical protein